MRHVGIFVGGALSNGHKYINKNIIIPWEVPSQLR